MKYFSATCLILAGVVVSIIGYSIETTATMVIATGLIAAGPILIVLGCIRFARPIRLTPAVIILLLMVQALLWFAIAAIHSFT